VLVGPGVVRPGVLQSNGQSQVVLFRRRSIYDGSAAEARASSWHKPAREWRVSLHNEVNVVLEDREANGVLLGGKR